MRWLFLLFLILIFEAPAPAREGQVNLDDIKIEGELQKEGLSIHSHDRFDIEKNISIPSSFRDLLLSYLPEGYHRSK